MHVPSLNPHCQQVFPLRTFHGLPREIAEKVHKNCCICCHNNGIVWYHRWLIIFLWSRQLLCWVETRKEPPKFCPPFFQFPVFFCVLRKGITTGEKGTVNPLTLWWFRPNPLLPHVTSHKKLHPQHSCLYQLSLWSLCFACQAGNTLCSQKRLEDMEPDWGITFHQEDSFIVGIHRRLFRIWNWHQLFLKR